jgi:hypothetical protein
MKASAETKLFLREVGNPATAAQILAEAISEIHVTPPGSR